MNAYQVFQAAFDSAQSEFIPKGREDKIDYVIQYADGAMGIRIERGVAEKIVDAQIAYEKATWGESGDGQYSDNAYRLIEEPLSKIEA